MAKLVIGAGSSHSPMLGTPPEHWGLRALADAKGRHPYKGKIYTFDELTRLRKPENFAAQITPEVWRERHQRCQQQLDYLGKKLIEADIDILIIIGDDQAEILLSDNLPAFLIYKGATVMNKKASKSHLDALPPGVAIAEWANEPAHGDQEISGAPDLAVHLIASVMKDGFDVSVSDKTPLGRFGDSGIPHAFGFYYHRILNDFSAKPKMATLPIFVNCFFPPNQPSAARTLNFGKALGQAIQSWDSDKRIGIAASGGFSHFVIDEDLDRRILKAMEDGDEATIVNEPDSSFQSGTSEIKNWLVVMGAMSGTGMKFKTVDYIPCYRSEAGTGNANTFGLWS